MKQELKDKRIVLVGGTTGLGLSAAKAFVAAGAQVVVVGRDAENGRKAEEHLLGQGLALTGDALHPETAQMAIARCQKAFGGFDGLYHIAGGSGRRAAWRRSRRASPGVPTRPVLAAVARSPSARG